MKINYFKGCKIYSFFKRKIFWHNLSNVETSELFKSTRTGFNAELNI